ncbi:MAG: helix-turn-helix transcriptional regulator [Bacteroidia bacterium]|nr:helix-turn-helix transcriptional regulator [Bacteroidia bacterium]
MTINTPLTNCSNSAKPSLETLTEIAKALDVDITELLYHTKK